MSPAKYDPPPIGWRWIACERIIVVAMLVLPAQA